MGSGKEVLEYWVREKYGLRVREAPSGGVKRLGTLEDPSRRSLSVTRGHRGTWVGGEGEDRRGRGGARTRREGVDAGVASVLVTVLCEHLVPPSE